MGKKPYRPGLDEEDIRYFLYLVKREDGPLAEKWFNLLTEALFRIEMEDEFKQALENRKREERAKRLSEAFGLETDSD